ncbi:MAG: phosphoribosyl-AMP cyclohydrolase [Actinobacteria bacterium]|nr:phosphoribosyl-AMP cyclohydrolase [Actinomycetota bacterium]NBY15598.1 phosphoribosyl-AMP cyclohydrolase [Actinomycetota bacterium]
MLEQPLEFLIGLKFNDAGLIPVVVQEGGSREVLMLAWMNQEAIAQTLETRVATYFSRSRNQLWVKGETSGNTQEVVDLAVDCDSDTLLLTVIQTGVACHTGSQTCFSERSIKK